MKPKGIAVAEQDECRSPHGERGLKPGPLVRHPRLDVVAPPTGSVD